MLLSTDLLRKPWSGPYALRSAQNMGSCAASRKDSRNIRRTAEWCGPSLGYAESNRAVTRISRKSSIFSKNFKKFNPTFKY